MPATQGSKPAGSRWALEVQHGMYPSCIMHASMQQVPPRCGQARAPHQLADELVVVGVVCVGAVLDGGVCGAGGRQGARQHSRS
jgi:hypothetical protein